MLGWPGMRILNLFPSFVSLFWGIILCTFVFLGWNVTWIFLDVHFGLFLSWIARRGLLSDETAEGEHFAEFLHHLWKTWLVNDFCR